MKKLAIIQNIFGSIANFSFLFFTSIVLLPYYFQFISSEDYGIWLSGISLLSLASVLEANISLIITQQLGSKWVNKEISEFSKYLVAALILGILIFSLIIFATYFLKDLIFHLISSNITQISLFSKAFIIYSFSLGFGILNSFIGSVTQVFLKTKWPPVYSLFSAILAVYYTYWAVSFQGVLALAWGLLIRHLVYFFLISIYSFVLLKRERIPFFFEKNYLNKIVKSIVLPFLSKIGMTIAINSQNFIVGVTIAAATVTIFDITKKIPFIIIMLINMVGVSTFTSFSLFYSEQKSNKPNQYTKYYFTLIRILLLFSLSFAFILGKDFVNIWVGLDKFGGDFLLALICFTALLDQIRISLSQQYYTFGDYNFTAITDAMFAIAFLLFVFILIPIFQLNGIVLAGIFANILYFIFCFFYEKYKNISLIISVFNVSFLKDLTGFVFLTLITKLTYEMIDNYYLKTALILTSIILMSLFLYFRHKPLLEFILLKFFKKN